jgi:N-formylglutamate amidohydrolase
LIGAAAFACAVLLSAGSACGPDGEAGNVTGPSPKNGAPPSASAVQPYAPGSTYFGRNAYIEFHAGTLPIIVSAPHGGSLEPAEIPSRTSGTTVTDVATEDLARALADALASKTGRQPSLVICRLKRTKIDVNRDIGEGAQGNPHAEQAWNEFHAFLDAAGALAAAAHGRALLVDVHGHGHPKPRVEIGYLLDAADLDRPDADLDDPAWARQSSIRTLAAESGLRFSALLRGPESLGGRLDRAGYLAVPGPTTSSPGSDPYFAGGYITRRHGSADGGPVSAVQLELPSPGVRDTPASRAHFAAVLADALASYFAAHFRIQL